MLPLFNFKRKFFRLFNIPYFHYNSLPCRIYLLYDTYNFFISFANELSLENVQVEVTICCDKTTLSVHFSGDIIVQIFEILLTAIASVLLCW